MGAYTKANEASAQANKLTGTAGSAAARVNLDAINAIATMTKDGPTTAFLRSFDRKLDLLGGGSLHRSNAPSPGS